MGWRCGGAVDRLVHLCRYIEIRAARIFWVGSVTYVDGASGLRSEEKMH